MIIKFKELMRKVGVILSPKLLLIVSVTIFYLTIVSIYSFAPQSFYYYSILKTFAIILPIISAFLLFVSEKVFPNLHKKVFDKFNQKRLLIIFIVILINAFTIFFFYQYFSTASVFLRSNNDAKIIDIFNGQEKFIGIIPKDTLIEFRFKRGVHKLLLTNQNQTVIKDIVVDKNKQSPITFEFDDFRIEKLEKEKKNVLTSIKVSSSNNFDQKKDLKSLFREKYEKSKKRVGKSIIPIKEFKISEKHSLYREYYSGSTRYFRLSFKERSFFKNRNNNFITKNTDYMDLIAITDKMAAKEPLSTLEKAFLIKAKPVFIVTIFNNHTNSIVMTNIKLRVISIEPVMGGGTKILRPEIMYEIEVPTVKGEYDFPIKENPLLVDEGSYGRFYLGLNSTNKIDVNGAILYPQINYELEICFEFDKMAISDSIKFMVLL